MTRLILSDGSAVNVSFTTTLSDFEDPAFFRVTDDAGNIIQPRAELYGEIIAAQTAFFLAKTAPANSIDTGLARVAALRDAAQARIDNLQDSLPSQVLEGITGIATNFVDTIRNPSPNVATGVAGVFSSLAGAVQSQLEIRASKGAAAAYEGLFIPLSDILTSSIETLRPNLALLDGRDLRSQDVLNAWLGVYDATFVATGAQQLFVRFEDNLIGSIQGLDQSLPSLLDNISSINAVTAELFAASPSTVLSQALADRLAPLGQTAVARGEIIEQLFTFDAFNAEPFNSRFKILNIRAEEQFKEQIKANSNTLATVETLSSGLGALLAGFGAVEASQQIDNLKLAIRGIGRAIDELVGDARLSAAFGTAESRLPFVQRAETLPIIGTSLGDKIIGSEQDDTVIAGLGADTINAGLGDDAILGGEGADVIDAGAGNDEILPGLGLDVITTGNGRDVIAGGFDELDGDSITDLSGADRIEFSSLGFFEELAPPVLANGVLTFRFQTFDEQGPAEKTVSVDVGANDFEIRSVESSFQDEFLVLSYALQPAMRTYVSVSKTIFIQDVGEVDPTELTRFVDGRQGIFFDSTVGANLIVTEDERLFTSGLVRDTGAFRHELIEFQPGVGGADVIDRAPLRFADNTVTVPGLPNPNSGEQYFALGSSPTAGGLAMVDGTVFMFGFGSVLRKGAIFGGEEFAHFSRVNMDTGILEPIRVFPFEDGEPPLGVISLDHDPVSGRLLALIRDGDDARIVSASTANGSLTTVANLQKAQFGGIDPGDLTGIAVTQDGQVIGIGRSGGDRNGLIDLDTGVISSYNGSDGLALARPGNALDVLGGNLDARLEGSGIGDFLSPFPGQRFIDGRGGDDFIFGLADDEVIQAGAGDDDIRPGLGRDIVNVGAGADTVRGTLEELSGDRIFGFGLTDKIVIGKGGFVGLTAEDVSFETGSIIVNIDSDQDGETDFSFTLEGDFDGQEAQLTDTGAELELTLAAVRPPPVAMEDDFALEQEVFAFLNLGENDAGPDGFFISQLAGEAVAEGDEIILESGALVFAGRTGITYQPSIAARQAGEDSFTYQISDGAGGLSTATVSLSLTNDNQAPVFGQNASFNVAENELIVGALTATDPDSIELIFSLPDGGTDNGLYSIDAETGVLSFLAPPDFEAPADASADNVYDLVISVSDGQATALQAVTVTVSDIEPETFENTPPEAADDAGAGFETSEDTSFVTASVLSNDREADGDDVTIVAFDADSAQGGAVILLENGVFTYSPVENFNGEDSFAYRIEDGRGGNDTARVTIRVTPVNDAPVAADVTASGDEDTVISGMLQATDVDGDTLSFSVVSGPMNGVVTVNANGAFQFTPEAGFNGTDSFTFRAGDESLSDNAVATITVNAVDEPVDPPNPTDPPGPVDPPAPTGPTNGDDILLGAALNDTINALAGNDNVNGLAGDDLLLGGNGDDSIKGAAGDDRLRGNGGDDTLKGGGGDDNIKGNGGDDIIRGNGGSDAIRAGGGNDNVKGGGGNDLILGGGGSDRLNGGGGADTLKGNGGDDTLKGNGGADVFQFRTNDRNDTIIDFRQGQDKIEIQNGANSFESLRIEQDGRDVLIGFGAAAQVRVVTDNAAAFDASDFIF